MINLAVLCIVKNERAEYLTEWRDYHASLGVEHTYLLEHAPNEIPIPDMPDTTIWQVEAARGQMNFYHRASQQIESNWVAVIDADEFIVSDDIHGLLDMAGKNADGLALNWMMFGSSGYENPVYPVHGSYRWRTPESYPPNQHIKSIVRPRAMRRPPGDPHWLGCRTVNTNGDLVTGPLSPYCGDKARINHYYTRSRADWMNKIARGRADCTLTRTVEEFEQINNDAVIIDREPTRIH